MPSLTVRADTLSARLRRHARVRPDDEAIGGATSDTFAGLVARVEEAADALAARGHGPADVVAVAFDGGVEPVIQLLGALDARVPFLVLDPGLPAMRLRRMVEISGAAEVIDPGGVLGRKVPASDGRPLPSWAADVAYVHFTSGSTGDPKGVVIGRRGLDYFAAGFAAGTDLGPGDRWLSIASPAFDAIIAEIFPALWAGATVCLPPGERPLVGRALSETVRALDATHFVATPSILAVTEPVADGSLRRVVSAGEACPRTVLERWRAAAPVFNAYGPTEGSVCATIDRSPLAPDGTVLAGLPLPGCTIAVLDADGADLPAMTAGEVVIGGAGVGLGYLNASDAPFLTSPRRYRTGDLGRLHADGRLELLGRADDEVKINGVRLSLSEVESVLATHPAIRAVSVFVSEDGAPAGRALGAAVQLGGDGVSLSDLRTHVLERLPSACAPTSLVVVAELPRTRSGKLDRRALAAMDRPSAQEPGAPPRDTHEYLVAAAWQRALGREAASIDDDFFLSGGTSLRAVALLAEIERASGRRLPLSAAIEAPTVRLLSRRLRDGSGTLDVLVPIRVAEGAPALVMVHPVGGNVFHYAALARRLPARLSVYGVQAAGLQLDVPPHTSIAAMAAGYLDRLRRLGFPRGAIVAGWSFGGVVAHEMACQAAGFFDGLVVIDTDLTAPHPRDFDDAALRRLVHAVRVPRYTDEVMRAPEGERLSVLLRLAVEAGQLPADFDLSRLRRMRDINLANMRAAAVHRPRWYDGTLHLLTVRSPQCEQGCADLTFGWSGHAAAVEISSVPGDHFELLNPPYDVTAAAAMTEVLGRIWA